MKDALILPDEWLSLHSDRFYHLLKTHGYSTPISTRPGTFASARC
jgi:hypothetical protein